MQKKIFNKKEKYKTKPGKGYNATSQIMKKEGIIDQTVIRVDHSKGKVCVTKK